MNDLYIVYGPPMSGKSLNAEAIQKILECDEVFDFNQQDQIRDALREGLRVMVLSHEAKPKTNKGYCHLFDGALPTHIDVFKSMLGKSWEDGTTRPRAFIVVRRVSLFYQGWCFKKPVYDGGKILEFSTREEAKKWVDAHPFTKDPLDVVKHIKYQIISNTQNA